MFRKLFIVVIMILHSICSFAQFPVSIEVRSNGQIFQSPNTKVGAKYSIIVEGTFSIWPQFTDCRGFDGAYVYEAPKEEIDGLRWPPEYIDVLGIKIEIFKLPKWVGDTTLYQFPPPNISKPVIELSLEKQKGFRINGKSLPNTGYNPQHKYEIELIGDGNPFVFQILDSNFNIFDGKTIPRYDDNCGFLTVYVSKHLENDSVLVSEICKDYFFEDKYHLDANIFFRSERNENIENLLSVGYNISLSFDNKTFNQTDINCKYLKGSGELHLLLDNSGSMLAGETKTDTIQRIDAAKNLVFSIIDILDEKDGISLICFGQSAQLIFDLNNLTQHNKTFIKDSLSKIEAGYKTDLLSGLTILQDQITKTNNQRKIILVLSDFADNINTDFLNKFSNIVSNLKTEMVLVNYAQGGNVSDIISNGIIDSIKNRDKLKVFSSKETNNILNYIIKKTGIVVKEDCCEVIFDFDPCYFQKDTVINAKLQFQYNDTTYVFNHNIEFKCQQGLIEGYKSNIIELNNNSNELVLKFNSVANEYLLLKIFDIMGNIVYKNNYNSINGENLIVIPISNFSNGIYLLNIINNKYIESYKFIKF